jgi:hypothetical protein
LPLQTDSIYACREGTYLLNYFLTIQWEVMGGNKIAPPKCGRWVLWDYASENSYNLVIKKKG